MSNKVDERITRIRFDNDQFERGVATSMQSLDRLKNKLESTESIDAFKGIQKSAENTDLGVIARAVEHLESRFTGFRKIAIDALEGIAQQAIRTGESLIKSLSVDNIAVGWGKYENEVQAVQTIMVTLDDTPIEEVEDHLKKIGWYSDETSYSYEEMVSSMSKLISSGVGLTDATNAVIGLANAAAAAGVSTKKAQQAFYNFSQAFGAGYMQLQDWRSIELLNMATPEFKKNILETAAAMGKIVKVGEDTYAVVDKINKPDTWFNSKNMRNSLKDKWFDTDVMTSVLNLYGEFADQVYETQNAIEGLDTASEAIDYLEELGEAVDNVSNKAFKAAQEAKTFEEAIESVQDAVSTKWKDTFKEIFGNYDESKKLWTRFANDLYDLFALGGDKRNDLLALWNDPGYLFEQMLPDERLRNSFAFPEIKKGREVLIDGLYNIYDSVVNVVNTIKAAWRDVFPEMTAFKLYELTRKFKETTAKIKGWTEDLDGVRGFLAGIFRVFKRVIDFWKKESASFTRSIFPVLKKFSSILKVIAPQVKQFFVDAFDYFDVGDKVTKGAGKLKRVLMSVRQSILDFDASTIKLPTFADFLDTIQNVKEKIGNIPEYFKSALDWIKGIFKDFNIDLGNVYDYISKILGWIGRIFKKEVPEDQIQKLVAYTDDITDSTRELTRIVNPELENLRLNIEKTWNVISDFFRKIQRIVEKVFSWFGKSFDDFDLKDALATGVIGVLSWFTIKTGKATEGISKMLTTLGESIANGVGFVLTSVGNLFAGFTGIANAYAKNIKADTITTYIKSIALSILAIVGALYIFSKIDDTEGKLQQAIKTIAIIGGVLAGLAITLAVVESIVNRTSKSQNFTGFSVKGIQIGGTTRKQGVLSIIAGIFGMVWSIKMIADLVKDEHLTVDSVKSIGNIITNLAFVMTTCIIALQAASAAINKFAGGKVNTSFLAPVSMASGMLLMIRVFERIDKMKIESTEKVVTGMLGIFITLGLFSLALGRIDAGVGIGMVGIAASILLFLEALQKIQDMDLNLEGKGGFIAIFFGILTVLGLISIFSKKGVVIEKGKQKLARVSTNMLSIILGLAACVGAIYLLGNMDSDKLLQGSIATISIVITLFGMMTLMIGVMGKAGQHAGKGLLGLSLLMIVLTLTIGIFTLLAKYDTQSLTTAVILVDALCIGILAMLAGLSRIGEKAKGIWGISALLVVLAGIVAAFYFFASNDEKKLWRSVGAVSVLAAGIGVMCFALSKMVSRPTFAEVIGTIAMVVGILTALFAITIALGDLLQNADTALKGAEAISLMGIAISIAAAILAHIPAVDWGQIGKSLLLFGGVSVILGGVVIALSKWVNGENLGWLKTFGPQLLALWGILVLTSAFLSAIGSVLSPGAALKGAGILLIAAGALALVGVALGAISYGLKKLFESQGMDIMDEIQDLIDITYAIGSLIGAFTTGIVVGALPNVGQSLSDFSVTIQPFVDFISSIPDGFGTKLQEFAVGFRKLTTSGWWYNIADLFDKGDLFTNTIEVFSKAAEPLSEMATKLSGIQNVDGIIRRLEFIEKLGPAISSINDAHTGRLESDVYPFLTDLANNIYEFGQSLDIIDDDVQNKIDWISGALNGIASAASNFYNEYGGLIQIGDIGTEIELLGDGIQAFTTATIDVDESTINRTIYVRDMLKRLLEINEDIGKNKGAVPWFTGWTSLKTFGRELGEFTSSGLTPYLTALGTITLVDLVNAKNKTPHIVTIMNQIASMKDAIGKNAGLLPTILGKTNYENFGNQLAALARGIISYSAELIYTKEDLNTTVDNTNAIAEAIKNLISSTTLDNMQKFTMDIPKLAEAAIEAFTTLFTSEETSTKVGSAIGVMFGYVKAAADKLADNYDFIKSIFEPVFTTIGNVITSLTTTLKNDISSLGDDVVNGFAGAFDKGKDKVTEAWAKVQKGVIDTGKDIMKVQSPSRVMFEFGLNIIRGEINGLLSEKKELEEAFGEIEGEIEEGGEETSETTANSLLENAKEAVSGFVDNIKDSDVGQAVNNFVDNTIGSIVDKGTEKLNEFTSGFGKEMDLTKWADAVIATGGNPFNEMTNDYYSQIQEEMNSYFDDLNYEATITPVLGDTSSLDTLANYQNMLGGSYGSTIAGYTSEDVRNLTAEIYHLEDALYSLKEAMKNQQVTHSGELTIRYSNESDFVDRIQTAIIGELRRGVRG